MTNKINSTQRRPEWECNKADCILYVLGTQRMYGIRELDYCPAMRCIERNRAEMFSPEKKLPWQTLATAKYPLWYSVKFENYFFLFNHHLLAV